MFLDFFGFKILLFVFPFVPFCFVFFQVQKFLELAFQENITLIPTHPFEVPSFSGNSSIDTPLKSPGLRVAWYPFTTSTAPSIDFLLAAMEKVVFPFAVSSVVSSHQLQEVFGIISVVLRMPLITTVPGSTVQAFVPILNAP